MNLTKNGFELLSLLAQRGPGKHTQKSLADALGASVGSVNTLFHKYVDAGLIASDGETRLTEAGFAALEPYRVKHAIVIAAGVSERLFPIVMETPKPLVTVRGVRLIDTLLDALYAAGIEDVAVVTGYKAEKFEPLAQKYPALRLIENPLYNEAGNIMSLYAARELLGSTYICDADLCIHNPAIIRRYEYSSCFFGTPVFGVDDWCFSVSRAKISHFSRGGESCYKALMISYLNADDSQKLREDLDHIIARRGGRELWWFDALFGSAERSFDLTAKVCNADDVSEIDTMSDLLKLDESYQTYIK